jgi:hypothetical protein
MTLRRAGVAQHKVHMVRKNQTGDKLARTPKGLTFGKKSRMKPEGKIGIIDPGTRWQLCLKIGRTSDGFDRKFFGLEFMKQATGMSN